MLIRKRNISPRCPALKPRPQLHDQPIPFRCLTLDSPWEGPPRLHTVATTSRLFLTAYLCLVILSRRRTSPSRCFRHWPHSPQFRSTTSLPSKDQPLSRFQPHLAPSSLDMVLSSRRCNQRDIRQRRSRDNPRGLYLSLHNVVTIF